MYYPSLEPFQLTKWNSGIIILNVSPMFSHKDPYLKGSIPDLQLIPEGWLDAAESQREGEGGAR